MLPGALPFDQARAAIERNQSRLDAAGPLVPVRFKATLDFYLGAIYLRWGDLKRAQPLIAASVPSLQTPDESPHDRSAVADSQAELAMDSGRHEDAERFLREALDIQKQLGAAGRPERVFEYARAAFNRSMQGRFDDADAVMLSLPIFETLETDDAAIAAFSDAIPRVLARLKLERNDPAAALELLPAAVSDNPGAPYPFDNLLLRGEILCALDRRTEGLALLEQSLRIHLQTDSPSHPHLARARAVTGLCAFAAGQPRRASELAVQARAALQNQPEVSPYFKRPIERLETILKATAVPR